MDISNREISYTRPLLSVQDIVNYIDKGEEYLSENASTPKDPMKYLGAIILNPTYQREYRSTIKEESLIIESILCNIPIPEVFLVQVPNNNCQVRNVMDGRHRLNAIYRFVKGKYKLQDFSLINNVELYNGKGFNDIPNEAKIRILTYKISVLEFAPLDSDEIERELFTRYNKATKPLEPQEIRFATYTSETSQYISSFIKLLNKNSGSPLYKAYNITNTRSKTQKVHQNIFVILSIIEYGLNPLFYKSTELADDYMQLKSTQYRARKENAENAKKKFDDFNSFVLKIAEEKTYPFSIRLFENKSGSGNYLFRTGVSMFLSAVYYYCNFDISNKIFMQEFDSLLSNANSMIDYNTLCTSNSKVLANNILTLYNQGIFNNYHSIKANSQLINELKEKTEIYH